MGSVAEQHHPPLSPPLQGRKIVCAVLKNGACIRIGNQTFDGCVPSFEHSQKLALAAFVRVHMIRIGIRRRIPGEPVIARSENAKTLSSSPGFRCWRLLRRRLEVAPVPSKPCSRGRSALGFQIAACALANECHRRQSGNHAHSDYRWKNELSRLIFVLRNIGNRVRDEAGAQEVLRSTRPRDLSGACTTQVHQNDPT